MRNAISQPILTSRPRPLGQARGYASSSKLDGEEYQRLYTELPFYGLLGMPKRSVLFRRKSVTNLARLIQEPAVEPEDALKDKEGGGEVDGGFTWGLLSSSLLAMQSTFLFGLHSGIVNPLQGVVFPGHSQFEWSTVVSIFCLGGLVGAVSGGHLTNIWGRKGAILVTSGVFFVSSILMALAQGITSLAIARFLTGIAAGSSTVFVPIYIGECAPPHLRGILGAMSQFHIVMGILVSLLLAFPFATPTRWRFFIGITAIPPFIQLVFSRFVVESPRLLLMKGQHKKACESLRYLRGPTADTEEEISLIVTSSQKEASTGQGGVLMNLQSHKVRYGLMVGMCLHLAQQLSGINAVFYYSTSFFASLGLKDPLLGSTYVGVINVVATVAGIYLMDNVGRRTLLLWSVGGMFFCTLGIIWAMSAIYRMEDNEPEEVTMYNLTAVVFVMAYVSFFEIGLGPIAWLIVAEIFTARLLSSAMGIATLLNWLTNFMVGSCYPIMVEHIGGILSWLPFAIMLLLTFVWSALFMVETKDKTLEEIQEEIGSDLSHHSAYDNYESVPNYQHVMNYGSSSGTRSPGTLAQNLKYTGDGSRNR